MSNIELYIVTPCPKCNSRNWMYYGDPNDLTYFEPEGLKCWSCKCCWLIEESEDLVDPEAGDEYFEQGRRFMELFDEVK